MKPQPLPWIVRFGICLALAILLVLLTPKSVLADLVYTDHEGDTIRLFEEAKPCPAEIAVRAPQGARGYLASPFYDQVHQRLALLAGDRSSAGPVLLPRDRGLGQPEDVFPQAGFQRDPPPLPKGKDV